MSHAHSLLNIPRANVQSLAAEIVQQNLNSSTPGFLSFDEKWKGWCVNGCKLTGFDDLSPVYGMDEAKSDDIAFAQVVDLIGVIPAQIYAVRLLKLAPGGLIRFHVDNYEKFSADEDWRAVRKVHVPIISNESCRHFEMTEDGEFLSYRMEPGQYWYLDGTKRHGACNFGDSDRWHLVVEVGVNAELERLRCEVDSPDARFGCRSVTDLMAVLAA